MHNTNWIDRPVNSQGTASQEETDLRTTYLTAQKIAFGLVCASNQLARVQSPDVTACAALIREAVHKPEKERANAVKAAELAVLNRQTDYISTLTYYLQHAEAWQAIRPTLVAQLEAVALPKEESKSRCGAPQWLDVDFCLNCEAVAALIDECDIAVNDATRRRYSRPTQKHAEAGFQKVFEALVAEVTGDSWLSSARLAGHANFSYDVLRDLAVDHISSTHVPAQYEHCNALDAAREQFERAVSWENNQRCREFNQSTRGSFNDTQLAERLLAASGNVSHMLQIEAERDTKLRAWGRAWRDVRRLVETSQTLFAKVAELLPAAVAEAAAIDDEKMRRQAQNLCLFAARRLKENIKFMREADRNVGNHDPNHQDVWAAAGRSHQTLVERIKSKELRHPSTRCSQEPYYG